jgi:hypothetical protein
MTLKTFIAGFAAVETVHREGPSVRSELVTFLVCAVVLTTPVHAQGHGPAYGLSTPTLGKGGWSIDVAVMTRLVGGTHVTMTRPMISYGVTEDFQVSASLPVPLNTPAGVPVVHGMSRMPTNRDVEVLAGWRFHRRGTGVGSRFESTAFFGVDYPTDEIRSGVSTSPGVYGALVTGYASRTIYAWGGALYRRYLGTGSAPDRPGDVIMYSAVFGYRPPAFRHDYPRPDWRVFVEAIGEWASRDLIAGIDQPNSGGHRVFVGPTLLGLYGAWGISGGPVFPVWRGVNGTQAVDGMRFVVNTTVWF